MADANGRIHLLLTAFAIFFAVAYGPVYRNRVSPYATTFPEAASFGAADHASDEAPAASAHEAHESVVVLRALPDVGVPVHGRVAARGLAERRPGRIVGFGDTPPPRAA